MNTINKKFKKKSHHSKNRKYYNQRVYVRKFFILVFLLIIFIILCLTVFFKIETIVVNCDETKKEEIAQKIVDFSNIKVGENLFLCKIKSAYVNIYNKIPEIDNLIIKKIFPHKIEITAEFAIPYLIFENFENSSEYLIISKNNKIIQKINEPTGDLPLIQGIKLDSYEICKFLKFEEPIQKEIVFKIIEICKKNENFALKLINVTNVNEITVNFENKFNVILGDFNDLDKKIFSAIEIINNKINPNECGTLNLKDYAENNKIYFSPAV